MNPHGCDRRKPGRMPAATHWRRCPPRAAGPGRRPRARRCRAAGADRRRAWPVRHRPCRPRGARALPALLQLMDARARAVAGPSTEPTQEAPAHALPKMPSLSVRPSWPILLPRLLAGPAVEPGRLRHLVAGPGPTARRPALDATRRRQRRHRLRPGPARQPDARCVLPANAAAGAVPQDNAIDPSHEYTLAELIDLAQSSNPRTRIAWNAARNAALATGMVKASTCRSWPPPP